MNVRDLIIDGLVSRGFDGLFNAAGECACDLDALRRRECIDHCPTFDCEPGYKVKCGQCDIEHEYHIQRERPAANKKACSCGWSGEITEMADHEGRVVDGKWASSARCPHCGEEITT